MEQQKIFGITIGKANSASKKSVKLEDQVMPTTSWVPTLPTINALPLSIIDKYESKALIKKFAVCGAAVAIIFSGLYGFSVFGEIAHRATIAELETESAQLTDKISKLQPYETYKVSVGTKMKVLASYLSTDVDVAKLLATVESSASSNGIVFSQLDVSITESTVDGTAAGGCVVTDPFNNTPSIGCLIFAGTQPDPTALKAFYDSIQQQEGFSNSFLEGASYTSTGEGVAENTFKGSVAFGDFFYSDKYTNLNLDIDTLINGGGLDQVDTTTDTTGVNK